MNLLEKFKNFIGSSKAKELETQLKNREKELKELNRLNRGISNT